MYKYTYRSRAHQGSLVEIVDSVLIVSRELNTQATDELGLVLAFFLLKRYDKDVVWQAFRMLKVHNYMLCNSK